MAIVAESSSGNVPRGGAALAVIFPPGSRDATVATGRLDKEELELQERNAVERPPKLPRVVHVELVSSANAPSDSTYLLLEGERLSPPYLPLGQRYTPPKEEQLLLLHSPQRSKDSPPGERWFLPRKAYEKWPIRTRETRCKHDRIEK